MATEKTRAELQKEIANLENQNKEIQRHFSEEQLKNEKMFRIQAALTAELDKERNPKTFVTSSSFEGTGKILIKVTLETGIKLSNAQAHLQGFISQVQKGLGIVD
jgi:hypothetical protein